jgi:hypothetical protein
MGLHMNRGGYRYFFAAMLLVPFHAFTAGLAAESSNAPVVGMPGAVSAEEYRQKLEAYIAARQQYGDEARAYWNSIADKRHVRITKRRTSQEILIDDYVLSQPPIYSSPPKPVDPSAPGEEAPPKKYVPVVTDFLLAAARGFGFVPQPPRNETEFKRAYARVASIAGLTREQVVRIYAFEAGGNGTYDVQAGLEQPTPGAQAISTALGYNQLLATNSVELMAEKGDQFIDILQAKAKTLAGETREVLQKKISVLRNMVDFSRSVPDEWSEHEKLADTTKGLGIHAMNLDIDVGPLLQTQKLLDSVAYAQAKGYGAVLTAAELEMMNLTGDGNGLDIVLMSSKWRDQVPTSNFFRERGYHRNPIVINNNVVSKLVAATNATMDQESGLRGAKELAALFP